MIKLALTGSIGMGKSTVAKMFERAGVPVFDADAEVRRLQAPGGALVAAIAQRFPGSVRDGMVDREALSALVLGKPGELAALEAIMHPAVHLARTRFIVDHAEAPALLFDIPLLFETNGEGAFDKVVTVSAPEPVQRERVLSRPGMTAISSTRSSPATPRRRQTPARRFRRRHQRRTSETETQVQHILACLGLAAGE